MVAVLLTCLVSICCPRIRSLHYCYGKANRLEHNWREMREFSSENQAAAVRGLLQTMTKTREPVLAVHHLSSNHVPVCFSCGRPTFLCQRSQLPGARVCALYRRPPLTGESERILPQSGHSTRLMPLSVNRLRSMGASSPENVQLGEVLVCACSSAGK